jgi:ATP-binding cassette subfamily C (CFTR/MRP) protein 1
LTCVATGFLFNFNTIWLKFWSDHNVANPSDVRKGYYLGIYATIQLCALASFGLFVQHNSMNMAVRTGILLHRKALSTVMAASLVFFTRTDTGTTVNRFSQDMTIIDAQLALGLSNTAATSIVAFGQAIVLALASPYLAICYPFLIAVLYIMQKVYLRTSRQLRFLDLESKAPL